SANALADRLSRAGYEVASVGQSPLSTSGSRVSFYTNPRWIDCTQSGVDIQEHFGTQPEFMAAIRDGYAGDALLNKVAEAPEEYNRFSSEDKLLYTPNAAGVNVLCIPRNAKLGGRYLTELVLTAAHETIGHLGEQRTSEYVRQFFWW
ncbi:hypothetical protein PENSPDRAFT_557641, partial [Peniophora sp. CONT]